MDFCFLSVSPQQLRQLLSESQEQLEAAKTETQKQSKDLALVRGAPGAALLGPRCSAWDWFANPAVGPASSLWVRGWEEGTASAWGNLVLPGTRLIQLSAGMFETQEEIFIHLPFFL